ncbi:MAG TPA: sel1 repeat family protein [Flavobacteriales bacterium]|nr:sel1 repeat family protein [Flavobacteriales bacterium]
MINMKNLATLVVLLVVSTIYAESNYQGNLHNSFDNKFISIVDGQNKYCFKGVGNKLKSVSNIGKCKSLDSIYLTNKGSICIETDNISCKSVQISIDGKYYWGKDKKSSINIFDSLDRMVNGSGSVLSSKKLLEEYSGKYIVIEKGNTTLCFKKKNNSFKVIKNIGSCKPINNVYLSNKSDKLCIDGDSIECKNIYATASGHKWGEYGDTVRRYNKLSHLDKVSRDENSSKAKNIVKNRHIAKDDDAPKSDGAYWGKKYYDKAYKYYKKKDYNNAYKWAKKSADLGYDKGYFGLGLAFEKGYGVVSKDKKEALKWYLKAAKLGHTESQFRAGHLLMFDDGAEAEKWYLKAADKGHLKAQTNLGYMYGKGMGSSIWGDEKLAYKYYLMAAKQGNKVAQSNVCLSLWKGRGVRRDIKKAIEWCQKSADQGYNKVNSLLQAIENEF